jgi:hypothetical protein
VFEEIQDPRVIKQDDGVFWDKGGIFLSDYLGKCVTITAKTKLHFLTN